LGYGTGFYAEVLAELGYENYLGVDISDTHVERLEKSNPKYKGKFQKLDVGSEPLDWGECDLVFMIDVSQHIVNEQKLTFCLQRNVKHNLKNDGFFIVTDSLSGRKYSFYEVGRSVEFYREALQLDLLHKPIQFRDKFIFSFVNRR